MNIKLLKDLSFVDKLNSCEPVTEAGKDMIKNYQGFLYTNPVNCSLVNSFVTEAQKYSFDAGMISVLESVLKYINENKISWKLATACESISSNQSTYSYIAKLGVAQVEKLLEMNEAEVISYIKAGSLKNIQYIPEFRAICKEVYKSSINEVHGTTYNVKTPVSFVVVNEEGQYFNVLGKTYSIKDGKVNEDTCKDTQFARINMLLESFTRNEDALEYQYQFSGAEYCKYSLTEGKLTFTKGNNINEEFETATAFRQYCDTLSRAMRIHEKMNFLNISNAVAEVFEAIDDIVALDPVKVMESSNGVVCAIIEAQDNVNMTVFRSINAGTSCTNYNFMIEALKDVTKLTGVDLKFMYENRINEDVKKENPEEYEKIKEELEANKEAQYDIRKKKIAMLAEKYKNDPAKIALLNSTARQLAMLESAK